MISAYSSPASCSPEHEPGNSSHDHVRGKFPSHPDPSPAVYSALEAGMRRGTESGPAVSLTVLIPFVTVPEANRSWPRTPPPSAPSRSTQNSPAAGRRWPSPNGAGKSTLLAAIASLRAIDDGYIRIESTSVDEPA